MSVRIFTHFRLTWRLLRDRRVNGWLKFFFVGFPLAYTILPFPVAVPVPDDFICVVGMLDDLLLFGITTLIFITLCPRAVVHQHEMALRGQHTSPAMQKLEAYRNPNETRDLASGFILGVGLLILGGYLAGILLVFIFGLSYVYTNMARGQMMASALQVSPRQIPEIDQAFQNACAQLPPARVNLFVTQNPVLNAYTFGLQEPYTIVLTSALVERLESDEIQAVIGHELGHVLFGHVRVISIMGTQRGAGRLLFYKWSRSSEYSADAAALLASGGDPRPAITSLLKLASGLRTPVDLQAFLSQLDGKSAGDAARAEMLSTHPFMHNRIRALLRLAQAKS